MTVRASIVWLVNILLTSFLVTQTGCHQPVSGAQYRAEERPTIPQNYRGVPTLVMDPNGREKCVSCQLCEFVCPPKAIRITPGEISEDATNAHVEKAPKEFEINMLRCIYCGLCQEVCPEEAIWLQSQYSMTGTSRESMVNNKVKLYELGGTLPDNHHKWDKKKEEADRQAHEGH
jgi:NADH-quinone oxidoreductase subunit I